LRFNKDTFFVPDLIGGEGNNKTIPIPTERMDFNILILCRSLIIPLNVRNGDIFLKKVS
jgi:hypothetical protein